MTYEGKGRQVMPTIRFGVKFLLAFIGLVAALRMLAVSFAFSRWTGFLLLGVVTIALYITAPRWVRWLPGLLIFGVINSLIGLITHRAPVNSQEVVSAAVAGMLLAFYAVGSVLTYYYDAARLYPLDRCALLLYLICMIWPAFVDRSSNHTVISPNLAWSGIIGMAALVVSFAIHRIRLGKVSFGA